MRYKHMQKIPFYFKGKEYIYKPMIEGEIFHLSNESNDNIEILELTPLLTKESLLDYLGVNNEGGYFPYIPIQHLDKTVDYIVRQLKLAEEQEENKKHYSTHSPHYKAGDKVIIRSDLLSNKDYEGYSTSKHYKWFKPGGIVTIDYYNPGFNFYVAEGDKFLTDKMIDHILTKKLQQNIRDIEIFKDSIYKAELHQTFWNPIVMSDEDVKEIMKDKSVSLNTLKILEY